MVFIILLLLLLLVYFSPFDSLSLNVFHCDSVVPMFVLSYFILFNPFVGAGGSLLSCGYCWPRGWFHPTGLGCWPTVGLFWAHDLHLQRMC